MGGLGRGHPTPGEPAPSTVHTPPGARAALGERTGEMKARVVLLATAAALVAVALSINVASAGRLGPSAQATTAASAAKAYPAPKVPNAAAIKKQYGGQSLTFIGDSVGGSHARDVALAKQFTKDTGIKVKVVPHPAASDASYSQLARVFSSRSSSFDVAMLDVVWPGAFAPYLVDLKPKLGKEAKQHAQGIIQNNTIDGKLVAMPWFGDFGILYYRTDLLKKYGYSSPPKTWNQLFAMAKKIQDGEQQANDKFSGLVFQGNSYEGLTCDALEWYQSAGAGNFIDNGKVTINNPKGARILDQFRAQIGKITPRDVTTYQEGEAHTAFVEGNAAFMRNWPYAYSIGQDPKSSKIVGKFSVTVLPHAGGKSVGTVGGWQLAVNKYSKHVDASIEFVRYMTSAPVQKFDAITNTNVPTIPAVAKDPAVVKANPYLKPEIANVRRVTRPARDLKTHYNEGSKAIYQGINQILNGKPASSVLPSIQSKLDRILR
jgi:trehalose/maltose transport system substrate-binding protein